MTQEDETPENMPPRDIERDVLAERRARRGELQGEGMLARRAELAEETAHALESRLSGIQERLREAERECASATDRLASREQELRAVSERLVAGERELRSVSARLTEREQELHAVSERLATREHDLRLLSQRLVDRERELREAELDIRDRIEGLETRLAGFQDELAKERAARIAAERELSKLQTEKGRVEQVLGELKTVAKRLREIGEAQTAAVAAPAAAPPAIPVAADAGPTSGADAPSVTPEVAAAHSPGESSIAAAPSAAEASTPAAPSPGELSIAAAPSTAAEPFTAAEAAASALAGEIGRPASPDEAPAEVGRPEESGAEQAVAAPSESESAAPPPEASATDRALGETASASASALAHGTEPREAAAPGAAAQPQSARDSQKGSQMAEALASAVERLRARVASVGELNERREAQNVGTAPAATAAYVPPAAEGDERRAWLAPAIRQMAEHGGGRLAGELIIELLPAQAQLVKGTLRYLLRIEELGGFEVELGEGRASVRSVGKSDGGRPSFDTDFTLEGPAAAFAEFAAGGVQRRPRGLRFPGRRRRARRLFSERRKPVALADLVSAGVQVWPGLLLAALAEAVDPAWTITDTFTVAFSIEGRQSAVLDVGVRAGLPLRVTRVQGERGPDQPAPVVTVRLGERGFLSMLSAQPLPEGEQVLLQGDAAALERLLSWTDRVQGIRRFGA